MQKSASVPPLNVAEQVLVELLPLLAVLLRLAVLVEQPLWIAFESMAQPLMAVRNASCVPVLVNVVRSRRNTHQVPICWILLCLDH